MDINLVHHLGASGRTLSIEEKATLQVTFLQRSREVCSYPQALKKDVQRSPFSTIAPTLFAQIGEPWEDNVLG